MLLKRCNRSSKKIREQYYKDAELYLMNNGFVIMQKILNIGWDLNNIQDEQINQVLEEGYPVASWIDKTDIIKQFVSLFKETGYIQLDIIDGRLIFNNEDDYKTIVQNHMKFSGRDMGFRLIEYCQQANGRLTYFQMKTVLGRHYPRASFLRCGDERIEMVMFLRATGMPFKFDSNYIYFP